MSLIGKKSQIPCLVDEIAKGALGDMAQSMYKTYMSRGEVMMQSEKDVNLKNNLSDIKSAVTRSQSRYSRIENFEYPEGVQSSVSFEIHFDAQLRRRVGNDPIMQMTRGEFGGRVGIWRLMDLFDKYNIKLTIFTPGRI